MRPALLILLCLAALASLAAHPLIFLSGRPPAAGTTYTLQETFGADTANASTFVNQSTRTYVASLVNPSSSYTVTRVDFRMLRVDGGGAAPTLTARIWADDGSNNPGTLLATSTNTVASGDVGTSMQWVTFTFTGQALTSGTSYWIGVNGDTTSASNHYNYRGGAISSGDVESSTAGSSWSDLSTRAWYLQTYVSP